MQFEVILDALTRGHCLQIHCDGGFTGETGAAAFVVHIVCPSTSEVSRAGYRGLFLTPCFSAFHAELTATDAAVEFVVALLGKSMGRRLMKRVIFDVI